MKDLNTMVRESRAMIEALGYELPTNIPVTFNSRLTRCLGKCSRNRATGQFSIQINKRHFDISDRQEVLNTIVHEFIHCVEFSHNTRFKAIADRVNRRYGINVQVKSEVSEEYRESVYKYTMACKSCGVTFGYSRLTKAVQNPEHYRCKCGGEIYRK